MKTEYFSVTFFQDKTEISQDYDNYILGSITASAEDAEDTENAENEKKEDKGGMIVVSTEVNAIDDPEFQKSQNFFQKLKNTFKTKVKNMLKSEANKWFRLSKTDRVIKEVSLKHGVSTGWSIGNFFKGRFFDKDTGKIYNEKSYAIDVRGVPYKFIQELAKKVAKEFDQKSVMVINHEGNSMRFIKS